MPESKNALILLSREDSRGKRENILCIIKNVVTVGKTQYIKMQMILTDRKRNHSFATSEDDNLSYGDNPRQSMDLPLMFQALNKSPGLVFVWSLSKPPINYTTSLLRKH